MIVSVVIPTYNRAGILARCLSALEREQDCNIPFEVIVVDDGSSDDTVASVRNLQKGLSIPVKLLTQENGGPASARNLAIQCAQGEILIFLGDDIVVEAGYMERMVAAYTSHQSDGCAVLGLTRYSDDSVSTPFGQWLAFESDFQFAYSSINEEVQLAYPLFYTSNLAVARQSVQDVGGFNPGFRYAAYEDTELGFRLQQRGVKLYFCSTARAQHLHPVSLTSTVKRMQMMAHAAADLRSLNPCLFKALFPRAEETFGRPTRLRRLVRFTNTEVLSRIGVAVDERLGAPLPSAIYSSILRSTFSRELSTLWQVGH